MTPSLVTFSIASAIKLPTKELEADTVATRAISSLPLTALLFFLIASIAVSTASCIPLRTAIGFAPAVTFFMPSRIRDCAKTVAVVVPSPATSFVFVATSLTSCAPMFSKGSASSISFAIVTPSFVISGAPYFLSSTTLRPFGPSVIFTVSESWSTPFISALRASSP